MEINTEEENLALIEMAEAARTSNGDQLDYWVGAMETESGWMWLSGAPMHNGLILQFDDSVSDTG